MLRSWMSDEKKNELGDVLAPKHVERVWAELEAHAPRYVTSLLAPEVSEGTDLLAALATNPAFRVTAKKSPAPKAAVSLARMHEAVEGYERDAEHYRQFFTADILQEYADSDPDSFKTELSKRCPVIRHTLNSKHEELKEWKFKYRNTSSAELLDMFTNLVALGAEYTEKRGAEKRFAAYDVAERFAMEDFNEEATGVPGVVGGGIKTTVLFHLDGRVFAQRNGRALYGLFFLAGKSPLGMRSGTSEFLMINDKLKGRDINIKQDHNYWYPYEIFALYAIRLYRILEETCRRHGKELDPTYRFVYVQALLDHVCEEHAADLKVLQGVDDLTYAFG